MKEHPRPVQSKNFGWMKHDPDLIALRDNADFIALTGG
jgi:hypothetical protein